VYALILNTGVKYHASGRKSSRYWHGVTDQEIITAKGIKDEIVTVVLVFSFPSYFVQSGSFFLNGHGGHPHQNCIKKCSRPHIKGLMFQENETKPYNAWLISENRAKTLNLAKLGLHTLAQG